MSLTKISKRQPPEVATCEFAFGDLTSAAYAAMVDLPLGAIVTGGYLAITTLFNSATTDKFSIGDQIGSASATGTTYSAQSADITATGRAVDLVPTGIEMTEQATVGVLWTGDGAAPSAGAGILVVEYIVNGRELSSFEH